MLVFQRNYCSMRAKATHYFYIRYPFPKSLSTGKGLTLGLKASKAVVSLCET